MAFVVSLKWPGVTPAQYDQVLSIVKWEQDHPDGGLGHIAWFEGDIMRVVDAWETPEKFQAFVDTRLTPGVAQAGIASQPEVEVFPAHRLFFPKALVMG